MKAIKKETIRLMAIQLFLIFTINFISFNIYGQSSSISTGVPFLLIAPNSRFGGMGETGTALADDATSVFWNPSGLAFQRGAEVNVTHSQWLPGLGKGDLFYDYIAGKKYIKGLDGTLGASLTYLNIGEVVVSDEAGNPQPEKNYKAFEIAFSMAYGKMLDDNIGGGVALRFIYSRLTPNDFHVMGEKGVGVGMTASFDLSGLYRPVNGAGFLNKKFSAGINLSNLGPKISYVDASQADALPTQLRIGFAYNIVKSEYSNLTLTSDFSKLLVNGGDEFYQAIFSSWKGGISGIAKSIQTSVGAEYWYGKPKLIALRAGYFYEDPSNGNRKFYTLGAGIRYNVYGFDFSYVSALDENSPLENTLRFGMIINF